MRLQLRAHGSGRPSSGESACTSEMTEVSESKLERRVWRPEPVLAGRPAASLLASASGPRRSGSGPRRASERPRGPCCSAPVRAPAPPSPLMRWPRFQRGSRRGVQSAAAASIRRPSGPGRVCSSRPRCSPSSSATRFEGAARAPSRAARTAGIPTGGERRTLKANRSASLCVGEHAFQVSRRRPLVLAGIRAAHRHPIWGRQVTPRCTEHQISERLGLQCARPRPFCPWQS